MEKFRAALSALRQPEYTGENRCGACTLVNLGLAFIGTAVSKRHSRTLGAVVGMGSVALIYFRGYLMPYTPELTKRHLPDSILRYFDHHEASVPTPDRSEPVDSDAEHDPLEVLVELGVVEPCAEVDDLCLDSAFKQQWTREGAAITDQAPTELVALLYEHDDAVSATVSDQSVTIHRGGTDLAQWPSTTAVAADLEAARALQDHVPGWTAYPPVAKHRVHAALRVFLEECPACQTALEPSEDTVESCCMSYPVYAIECEACASTLLEQPVVS